MILYIVIMNMLPVLVSVCFNNKSAEDQPTDKILKGP